MRARKSNNKRYSVIAGVSIVLILAIVAVIFYKNSAATTENTNGEQSSTNMVKEDVRNNEGNSTASASSNGENSEPSSEPEVDANESNGTTVTPSKNADYIEGQEPATEPTFINGIMLVNKQHQLPSTYNKGEDRVAKQALDNMLAVGKEAGFEYEAFSGFRSYEYQTTLYNRYVSRDGKEAADRYSARPGHSEHQTGLAFDIGEKGKPDLWLTEAFGETEAGKWLMANAHYYGFILRYPKGKEHITGFMYESWHYRYIGEEHAEKIYKQNVTLEEYLKVVK